MKSENHTTKQNILIVGIDGGTWSVLKPAMDQGHMPFLKSFVENGTSGNLQSTIPPKTAAAWSAFQTGLNPGHNGVFDFSYWDRNKRQNVYANSTVLQKTMWEYAGDAHKKVATINVPMTYPVRKINGYVVSGLLTPSLESDFTWPPEFKTELLNNVPGYHIFNLKNIKQGTPHNNPEFFIKRMIDIINFRTDTALHLIHRDIFDLFMVHFQASDVIQHVMWGYMQSDHALYNTNVRSVIFRFYEVLDRNIKKIHEAFCTRCGPDSTLYIISDHGFQTHRKRFNLGKWLCDEGFLKIRKPSLAQSAKRLLNTLRGKKQPAFKIDWDQTSAFSCSRGNDGFVYLLEKDPQKRRSTLESLSGKAMEIKDPDTGTPIIRKVWTKEEIYSGQHLERMPDLILIPDDGYSITGNSPNQKYDFQHVTIENDFHIGMHHQDGILVAHGKNIHPGKQIEKARLIDMAPTILASLDVPIPQNLEGTVLQELFVSPVKGTIKPLNESDQAKNNENVYSQEDIGAIEDRLRDLGYIE